MTSSLTPTIDRAMAQAKQSLITSNSRDQAQHGGYGIAAVEDLVDSWQVQFDVLGERRRQCVALAASSAAM